MAIADADVHYMMKPAVCFTADAIDRLRFLTHKNRHNFAFFAFFSMLLSLRQWYNDAVEVT